MTCGKMSMPAGRYHPNTESAAMGSQPNTKYPLPSPNEVWGKENEERFMFQVVSSVIVVKG